MPGGVVGTGGEEREEHADLVLVLSFLPSYCASATQLRRSSPGFFIRSGTSSLAGWPTDFIEGVGETISGEPMWAYSGSFQQANCSAASIVYWIWSLSVMPSMLQKLGREPLW